MSLVWDALQQNGKKASVFQITVVFGVLLIVQMVWQDKFIFKS
jgi:hypothetical protein